MENIEDDKNFDLQHYVVSQRERNSVIISCLLKNICKQRMNSMKVQVKSHSFGEVPEPGLADSDQLIVDSDLSNKQALEMKNAFKEQILAFKYLEKRKCPVSELVDTL